MASQVSKKKNQERAAAGVRYRGGVKTSASDIEERINRQLQVDAAVYKTMSKKSKRRWYHGILRLLHIRK